MTKENAGWGHLIKNYHANIDVITEDSLQGKHDSLITPTSLGLYKALEDIRLRLIDEFPKEKELRKKVNGLLSLYLHASSLNDKVIFITLTEQFVRSIY